MTVTYTASCPGCGADCSWHATPVGNPGQERPQLRIECVACVPPLWGPAPRVEERQLALAAG